jgi:hypothetical protein
VSVPSGETDLPTLLRTLRPALHPDEWVFCAVDGEPPAPAALGAMALVREAEGWTAVVPRARADAAGWAYARTFRLVTCTVHSSLAAVGMLAAITAALAARGIAVNALAGLRHDHLLVPAARGDETVAVLRGLAEE